MATFEESSFDSDDSMRETLDLDKDQLALAAREANAPGYNGNKNVYPAQRITKKSLN